MRTTRSKISRPKVVDLFAGAGGLSLGFEQAGFDLSAIVEFDPIHCATHEFNFPETAVICADIRDVTGSDILSAASLEEGELDVLIGGPPCQGFSMMGKRALDDPRNELIAEFGRIALELQPKYFVMENVAGLTLGKHRSFLSEVIDFFKQNDYQLVLPYKVLDAANFGVPQHRERLFLIGAQNGLPFPNYPANRYHSRRIRPKDDLNETSGSRPLGPRVIDALGDLPDADAFKELEKSDKVEIQLGSPHPYASILRGELKDFEDFSHRRVWNNQLMTSSARTEHTEISINRFAKTQPGMNETVSRFLRLHPEGISNTLRAGTNSDRGAHTAPRPIHPIYNRVITVREAARLHSYPDWFRFHVSKWHGFRQIGNSVPPLLARAVAAELFKVLRKSHGEIRTLELGPEEFLSLTPANAATKYSVHMMPIAKRTRKAVAIG